MLSNKRHIETMTGFTAKRLHDSVLVTGFGACKKGKSMFIVICSVEKGTVYHEVYLLIHLRYTNDFRTRSIVEVPFDNLEEIL